VRLIWVQNLAIRIGIVWLAVIPGWCSLQHPSVKARLGILASRESIPRKCPIADPELVMTLVMRRNADVELYHISFCVRTLNRIRVQIRLITPIRWRRLALHRITAEAVRAGCIL